MKTTKKSLAYVLLLLLICVLFSACRVSASDYEALRDAAAKTDSAGKGSVSFVTSISFGEAKTSLLFVQGSYDYVLADGELTLNGKFTETAYGESFSVEFSYSDGIYKTVSGDETTENEASLAELRDGSFLFSYASGGVLSESLPKSLTVKRTVSGNKSSDVYDFTVSENLNEIIMTLLGEDIYSLCLIDAPRKELAEFGNISCRYVSDADTGLLTSRSIEYTLSLFDTPPYTPGYTPDADEYSIDLQVSMRSSYTYN